MLLTPDRQAESLACIALALWAAIAFAPFRTPRSLGDDQASGGALSGRVVDVDGRPVAGSRLTLYPRDRRGMRLGRPIATFASESGAYEFPNLPAGEYNVIVDAKGFATALQQPTITSGETRVSNVTVGQPVSLALEVVDSLERPVKGASVRELRRRGANGFVILARWELAVLGLSAAQSDARGNLRLPMLPNGELVRLTVDHPDFAPARLPEVPVRNDDIHRVEMRPGVGLALRISSDDAALTGAWTARLDLRSELDDSDSNFMDAVSFDSGGSFRATFSPGNYRYLALLHNDYHVTPEYRRFKLAMGRDAEFRFHLLRKVTASGRVVDVETGRPLPDVWVLGEIPSKRSESNERTDRGSSWEFVSTKPTDESGAYVIQLVAGPGRVRLWGEEYVLEGNSVEFEVRSDGTSVVPDLKVRRLPRIRGVVKNPDGTAAPGAVVRVRGPSLRGMQPVVSDPSGRFELPALTVPFDEETNESLPVQPFVAFDPYRPLAGSVVVRVDTTDEVEIKLEKRDRDWLLTAFDGEQSDWELAKVSDEQRAALSEMSLRGSVPPELEGLEWLNVDGGPLKLADFRGKYVLLDFWATWCGPCHADFPSLRLLHELYKDRGLIVIGVLENSQPIEAARKHVAKLNLPFPVVVDHFDGRMLSRYGKHGIAGKFPNYVLIGPDGTVLLDDRTICHPQLRLYKIEILRALLAADHDDRDGVKKDGQIR